MTSLRVLGTSWCGDCARSKAFLQRHGVVFEWTDIELDDDAASEVEALNDGHRIVPTIIFPDGDVLVEPSDGELATKLDIVL